MARLDGVQVRPLRQDGDTVRVIEHESIYGFVESAGIRGCFRDRTVLDYGCGRQPYRALVEKHGGRYAGFDSGQYPGHVLDEREVHELGANIDPWLISEDGWARYGAVLCTQVLQYVEDPLEELRAIHTLLEPGGHLVLTGPTNWPVVEVEDLHRFTIAGITRLLNQALFEIDLVADRAAVELPGFRMSLGYGVQARRHA